MDNNWYKEHTPFFIEVEFNKLDDNTQFALLDAALNGKEILPGLKVNKCYNQITDADTILTSEMNEDFAKLIGCFNNFQNKWQQKLQDHKIDQTVKVEGGTSTLSDQEKERYTKPKNDFLKNNMESDWIEMNGKTQTLPDMIF